MSGRLLGLDGFVALHARAAAALLSPADRDEYRRLRSAFRGAMLDLQNAGLASGQHRRATVRIRRAVQVDLSGPSFKSRTATLDVGLGGFSALLPEQPSRDAKLTARLRASAQRSVEASVTVVSARRRLRAAQVSFAFGERAGDWTAFEEMVVDHLLSDLGAGRCAEAGDAVVGWLREAGRGDVLYRAG